MNKITEIPPDARALTAIRDQTKEKINYEELADAKLRESTTSVEKLIRETLRKHY